MYLDLLKMVGKNKQKSPNGGFMVIYHGRIRKKKNLKQTKVYYHQIPDNYLPTIADDLRWQKRGSQSSGQFMQMNPEPD